jgi:hypothetical protein
VLIGGQAVGDTEGYLAVYEDFPAVAEPANAFPADGVHIALETEQATPWTDGHNQLAYLPGRKSSSVMVSGCDFPVI